MHDGTIIGVIFMSAGLLLLLGIWVPRLRWRWKGGYAVSRSGYLGSGGFLIGLGAASALPVGTPDSAALALIVLAVLCWIVGAVAMTVDSRGKPYDDTRGTY